MKVRQNREKRRKIITFLSHPRDFPGRYQVEIADEQRQAGENKWRKRVRVERTGDIGDAARRF